MRRIAVVAAVLAACKPVDVVLLESGDGGPAPIAGLRALRIEPALPEAVIDRGEGARATIEMSAIGTFDDGERDVTERVAWTVGAPVIGRVTLGRFESIGIAGRSFVEARAGSVVATAPIEVRVDIIVDRTPAQIGDSFPEADTNDLRGADAPVLEYPADGVRLPSNVASLEPQWSHASTHDRFELRFESALGRVRLFTDTPSVRLDEDAALVWILRAHVDVPLSLTVRSASSSEPSVVHRSDPVRVSIERSAIEGTGYFMSTAPPAILRTQFAQDVVEQLYPPVDEQRRCTGCHVLSRDGRRLATTRGDDDLVVLSLETRETSDDVREGDYEWGAFNPGATRLVFVDEGKLRVRNLTNQSDEADVPLGSGNFATHPDWSPDGRFLIVAYSTTEKPEKYEFKETSIARIDVAMDGSFSSPRVLVAGDGNTSLVFPAISRDGRYIAYTRAVGNDGRGPMATIELISVDGGTPVVLRALNERVGPVESVTSIRNLAPTWLPTLTSETAWIAFSSRRAYGTRRAQGSTSQLWIAAIDTAAIGGGADPSAPAFWYTPQPIGPSNYRLQFAAAEFDQCASIVEVCNGVDDDCDQEVDEACCTPTGAESCGNITDDDCDGLVDEGCDCSGPEVCDNGLDDDCDREIDDRDDDCSGS